MPKRTYENEDHPESDTHGSDHEESEWENEFELDEPPDTVQISTPGE